MPSGVRNRSRTSRSTRWALPPSLRTVDTGKARGISHLRGSTAVSSRTCHSTRPMASKSRRRSSSAQNWRHSTATRNTSRNRNSYWTHSSQKEEFIRAELEAQHRDKEYIKEQELML